MKNVSFCALFQKYALFIFFLFLSLFYEFAVHGDDQPQNDEIDTNEFDEGDKNILAKIEDGSLRYLVKKTLWEKEQKIRNNRHSEVLCGMSQIEVYLETGYPANVSDIPIDVIKDPILRNHIITYIPKDIYILIKQDREWINEFTGKRFANKDWNTFYTSIRDMQKNWMKFFYIGNGQKLAELIAPLHLDESIRRILLSRFAFSMARLFKIACVSHHKLLHALEQKIHQNPSISLLDHFKQLVPLWSCTLEQVKFYDILAKYVYSNSQRLDITIFKKVTIGTYGFVFVIPHTNQHCGRAAKDEEKGNMDTYEFNVSRE